MNVICETQLAWPADKPKSFNRKKGRFQTSISDAISRVKNEVSMFTTVGKKSRTRDLTIYTNGGVLGARGEFLSRSVFFGPEVSVAFDLDGKQYMICADAFDRPEQNLAGIAEYIKSIRAQERNGIFTPSQMLTAFAALLPSNDPGYFADCTDARQVEAQYRNLARTLHPDVSADPNAHDKMAQLNAQRDLAMQRIQEQSK